MLSIFDRVLKVYTIKANGFGSLYTPVCFCKVVQQQN